MDITKFDLRSACRVNTNEDGDRFVGVKIENDQAIIYFPIGYRLPEDDRILRKDIRSLFGILSTFTNKEDKMIKGNKFVQAHPVDFPILAFLDVLDFYMENNGQYYMLHEKKYKADTKGKINWKRTARSQKAFIKDGSPIYTKFQVEYQSPLENELITRIHKYCVFQSFKRLGWLYTNQMIHDPGIPLNKKEFIDELRKRYRDTQKDRDKRLFKSMIAMIEFIDNRILDKTFYFGTDDFEYIWEKIIDKVFGISNKEDYFPRAVWTERYGEDSSKETSALLPDTIMIYNDKVYIVDAKYYRYGITKNSTHLPKSSDINKQITYGEYAHNYIGISNDSLFNAFLMPFNMRDNLFGIEDAKKEVIENVAESYGKWKLHSSLFNYEKVQGIVIDIRYIMMNYLGDHDEDKKKLAESIEKYILKH